MKWNIIADSACDLRSHDIECESVGFATVPFIITIGGVSYIDDENANVAAMLESMEKCAEATRSACPAPAAWEEHFEKAENSIAVTISGNLSGSFNSARVARDTVLAKHPEKKIAVLDSLSTGPEIMMCIKKMAEDIKQGADFDAVVEAAQKYLDEVKTSFALCSFDNLVKNGRMGKLAGFIARRLGMWGVGVASPEGTIAIKGKTRGVDKAMEIILSDMDERGFKGEKVVISHSLNEETAQKLKKKILEKYEKAEVEILAARGLDSYYAERGGIIVGFY